MNKKDIIKAAVIITVVLFITQSFFMGGGFRLGGGPGITADNVSGTTVFNGTIRTYDPILVLPPDVDQSIIDELRDRQDVMSVRLDPQGVVVETETRDDVYPLALYLRDLNVSSVSVANIALPDRIEVQTDEGRINVTTIGAVSVITEPLLDADSQVMVSMVAVVSNDQLIGYDSAAIMLQPLALELDANVDALNHKVYTYTIPWESRNSVGNLSGYGTVEYNKVDSIVFDSPLTLDQIVAKKQFPYITYIDAYSAMVASGFDNTTQIQSNFQDVPLTLPPSTLEIMTNQTPDLPFDSTVSYSYAMSLPEDSGYEFEELSFTVETDKEYEINSTVKISIDALAAGNRIISVSGISLPS